MALKKILKQFWKDLCPRVSPYLYKEIFQKKNALLQQTDSVETLVLGSSHGALGFNPSEFKARKAFNLASTNLDLYSLLQEYQYYVDKLTHLKEVIVFYSVFSKGHEIDKGKDTALCTVLNYFYGFSYPHQNINRFKRALKHRIKKYKPNERLIALDGYFPIEGDFEKDVRSRTQGHLRENHRTTDQTYHLEEILKDCQRRKIAVKVVISPCRKDYNELIKEADDILFSSLFSLQNKYDFKLYNLRCSGDFIATDFLDCDHLNKSGAVKLTHILDDKI